MQNNINTSFLINGRNEINTNKNNSRSFKGMESAALTGLRFLEESPAIGACSVDFLSMVVPRTAVETKQRGPQSGIETFFREIGSCVLHACVGLIGFGAATLISGKFNDKYGVKAQEIFAGETTIKNLHSHWNSVNGQKREFFDKIVSGMEGLEGSALKKVTSESKEKIVDGFMELAEKTKEVQIAKGVDKSKLTKEAAELRKSLIARIVKDTGAQKSFRLQGAEKGIKEISSNIGELTDNAVNLANTFATKSKDELPEFVSALTKNKTKSALLGLAIASAISMSVQPINRYLTKKRTGSDGFVGTQGNAKKDDSEGFKTAKKILGIGFPLAAIATIGAKPSNLLNSIQFNSKVPTLNQFKVTYGLTIGSRFLAARDKNELREGVVKDTLGFANWLILGNMVSKLTARAIGGKELINTTVKSPENGKKGLKYAFDWLTKSSVKSYDEVLLPKSKELFKDGKLKSFSKLVKEADSATKGKLAKIAFSQAAGYIYSGLVLGIGISKLNIAITKHMQAKNDAKSVLTNEMSNKRYDTDYMKKLNSRAASVFGDFRN